MIRLRRKCTIHEIMADPRYREFAAASTECGRQLVPEAFPWNAMGLSDVEIVARPLKFASGRPMPDEKKALLIPVVRAQEILVASWWNWWLSWEWIANSRKPAPEHIDDEYAQAEAARANRQPEPARLF